MNMISITVSLFTVKRHNGLKNEQNKTILLLYQNNFTSAETLHTTVEQTGE